MPRMWAVYGPLRRATVWLVWSSSHSMDPSGRAATNSVRILAGRVMLPGTSTLAGSW